MSQSLKIAKTEIRFITKQKIIETKLLFYILYK